MAHRVCSRCTQRRKKCDKLLPKCSFCARNGLSSDYPPTSLPSQNQQRINTSTPPSPQAQQQRLRIVFPSTYFLDASVFQQCHFELPTCKFSAPPYVAEFVGASSTIRHLGDMYFNNVHPWMPIISKRHYYQRFDDPQYELCADIALLIVTMRLILWSPSPSTAYEGYKSRMYQAAKQYYAGLETAGLLTLPILQAGVLITLYEFGHAIYPSAYFSIGACARYGVALGIDRAASLLAEKSSLWVEIEEKRRVWWAILILDRSISLGSPLHSLATADLKPHYILPMDDELFDIGTSPPQNIYTLSSQSPIEMGRFARFAQATYLLSRVLRHVSDSNMDREFRTEESAQLLRTLSALVNLTTFEGEVRNIEFCTQKATCYCAILILQEAQYSNDKDAPTAIEQELESTQPSTQPSEAVARKAAAIAQTFHTGGPVPCPTVSPFIFQLLYRSVAVLNRVIGQTIVADDSKVALVVLKRSLELLKNRWGAADAYTKILESQGNT